MLCTYPLAFGIIGGIIAGFIGLAKCQSECGANQEYTQLPLGYERKKNCKEVLSQPTITLAHTPANATTPLLPSKSAVSSSAVSSSV